MNTFYNHLKKMFPFSDNTYRIVGVVSVATVFSLYHLLRLLEGEQVETEENGVVDEMKIPSELQEEM